MPNPSLPLLGGLGSKLGGLGSKLGGLGSKASSKQVTPTHSGSHQDRSKAEDHLPSISHGQVPAPNIAAQGSRARSLEIDRGSNERSDKVGSFTRIGSGDKADISRRVSNERSEKVGGFTRIGSSDNAESGRNLVQRLRVEKGRGLARKSGPEAEDTFGNEPRRKSLPEREPEPFSPADSPAASRPEDDGSVISSLVSGRRSVAGSERLTQRLSNASLMKRDLGSIDQVVLPEYLRKHAQGFRDNKAAKEAAWKEESGVLMDLACRFKIEGMWFPGVIKGLDGDRCYTILSSRDNKLVKNVDKNLVAAALPEGDGDWRPDVQCRFMTAGSWYEGTIQNIYTDKIVHVISTDKRMFFVEKKVVTPRMPDGFGLIQKDAKVQYTDPKGSKRVGVVHDVYIDETCTLNIGGKMLHCIPIAGLIVMVTEDGDHKIGGKCRFKGADGEWHNGVIDTMLSDGSCTISGVGKLGHKTVLQKECVNPVAANGIHWHQKGAVCRLRYMDEWTTATIHEVYSDGSCAVTNEMGTIIYEVPADDIVPVIKEGDGDYIPGVECRILDNGKWGDGTIVHVFANDMLAVQQAGKTMISYAFGRKQVNPLKQPGNTRITKLEKGDRVINVIREEWHKGDVVKVWSNGCCSIRTVGAGGIGKIIRNEIKPENIKKFEGDAEAWETYYDKDGCDETEPLRFGYM